MSRTRRSAIMGRPPALSVSILRLLTSCSDFHCRVIAKTVLSLRPVALLVFLPRSTRAWIVAAHFVGTAHHLLHGLRFPAPGHARRLELAALLPLEGFLQIVNRGCNVAWRPTVAATGP